MSNDGIVRLGVSRVSEMDVLLEARVGVDRYIGVFDWNRYNDSEETGYSLYSVGLYDVVKERVAGLESLDDAAVEGALGGDACYWDVESDAPKCLFYADVNGLQVRGERDIVDEHPRDDESFGKLFFFVEGFRSDPDCEYGSEEELVESLEEGERLHWVRAYSHGKVEIFVVGSDVMSIGRSSLFDSDVVGVFVLTEEERRVAGGDSGCVSDRERNLRARLDGELSRVADWMNGEVYGLSVYVPLVEGVYVASDHGVGGVFGSDMEHSARTLVVDCVAGAVGTEADVKEVECAAVLWECGRA